jgi:hypothetical protein
MHLNVILAPTCSVQELQRMRVQNEELTVLSRATLVLPSSGSKMIQRNGEQEAS